MFSMSEDIDNLEPEADIGICRAFSYLFAAFHFTAKQMCNCRIHRGPMHSIQPLDNESRQEDK
jgi:hypothetical protein